MKFDWKELVSSVAPVLGKALGGPFGGMAASAISNVLLGKENATEEELEAAVLSATPEKLLEIKKVDAQFKKDMKALDVDLEKSRLGDVQNSRELAKLNMWPQIILSAIFIGGYFWIVFALITKDLNVDPDQSTMVNVLLGVLTAGVANIMQFWFGSSHGSKQKTNKK